MISIKKSHFKIIVILLLSYLVGYTTLYLFKEYTNYQNNITKRENLRVELQTITQKNKEAIGTIKQLTDEKIRLEQSYDSQDIVEKKLKRIFKRLSFRYKISLETLDKLAFNHYIIVAKVDSNKQAVIDNFADILSHLGKVKQSEKNKSILYVDYIMEKNHEKK